MHEAAADPLGEPLMGAKEWGTQMGKGKKWILSDLCGDSIGIGDKQWAECLLFLARWFKFVLEV